MPPSLVIAPLEVLTDSRLSDPERRVLFAMYSFRGKDTNTVWPSLESLSERALIKDKTRISKLTKSLVTKGWMTKKKRGFTGGNKYTLTVPANLDADTNLAPDTKMDGDTNSNLDSDANSNLDSDAKCKEQTNEQTNEQVLPKTTSFRVLITEVVNLYHEKLPTLPKIVKLTSTRKSYIKQRWKEDLSSLEAWGEYFEYVSESDFLMGRKEGVNGRKPFIADLEWLTKPGNIVKVVEGKYHG